MPKAALAEGLELMCSVPRAGFVVYLDPVEEILQSPLQLCRCHRPVRVYLGTGGLVDSWALAKGIRAFPVGIQLVVRELAQTLDILVLVRW